VTARLYSTLQARTYDELMVPDDLMPFPAPGRALRASAPSPRERPTRRIPDVSEPEIFAYIAWLVATFAVSLAATLVVVHRAISLHPRAELTIHFLIVWGATWGGSVLLLSILAGALVFRRATPWEVVLTWPWLAGLTVGVGYFAGLTGHMDGGSKLCDAPANGSCDTAWGLGAVVLSIAASLALGGTFIVTATLKRLLPRLRRRASGGRPVQPS